MSLPFSCVVQLVGVGIGAPLCRLNHQLGPATPSYHSTCRCSAFTLMSFDRRALGVGLIVPCLVVGPYVLSLGCKPRRWVTCLVAVLYALSLSCDPSWSYCAPSGLYLVIVWLPLVAGLYAGLPSGMPRCRLSLACWVVV